MGRGSWTVGNIRVRASGSLIFNTGVARDAKANKYVAIQRDFGLTGLRKSFWGGWGRLAMLEGVTVPEALFIV